MKINFIKSVKNHFSLTLILTEEQVKSSKLDSIKLAKNEFNFTGKKGQIQQVADDAKIIVLIGAGKEKDLNDLELQKIGASVFSSLNGLKIKNGEVAFDTKNSEDFCNIAFGAMLKSYRFNKYFNDKKESKNLKIESLDFITKNDIEVKKKFKELEALADNIFLTRNLVSEPSNILNPESYAKICQEFKKDGLIVEVLGEAEMQKLKMNALLGVGLGDLSILCALDLFLDS